MWLILWMWMAGVFDCKCQLSPRIDPYFTIRRRILEIDDKLESVSRKLSPVDAEPRDGGTKGDE